ncbi:MAG: TonB-dependent receptor [Bacteroidales bacterium]|nr:TonB-dependent receptor [Bacteroidales bacterium]
MDGVSVTAGRERAPVASMTPVQMLDGKEMNVLPVAQLGDVLKMFAGLVIRDYGGVGGMKTVSMRGFGAQHTAVAYDGISVSDCQTGQIDISKFSLEQLDRVSLGSGDADEIFLPARLSSSASLISLHTPRPSFTAQQPIHLDFHLTAGSFGLWNPSLKMENRIAKKKNSDRPFISSSLNINYLQSKGNYPFLIFYGGAGDSVSRERRANSDVRSVTVEENLFFDFSAQSNLQLKLYYYWSHRGLPGAVIFYNTHSAQRLKDENIFAQAHYENRFNAQWAYQLNAKFNFARQQYYDPDYLNDAGFLDNHYLQREWYVSNTVLYKPHRILSLSLSNDLIYGNMSANLHEFCYPSRFQMLTALSLRVDTRFVDIRAGLLHTGVANGVKQGRAADNLSRFSPSAGLSVKPLLSEEFYVRAFYKNIFRLPSFNDLYYMEVGNRDLKPEDTHQINVGLAYAKDFQRGKVEFSCTVDGYYNRVKNKIVAIPSKNLFVWSMLNFGKVDIGGLDVGSFVKWQIIKQLSVSISGSYTLQYAVDVTHPESKTYRHQIPYTPLHSGSAALVFVTPWVEVSYTVVAAGKRYALQQNVPANELPPYADHSIALGKDFNVRDKVVLGGKIELLNLADRHYEIVRWYPMQGRSFRVGLHLRW